MALGKWFTDEEIEAEADAFEAWMQLPESIFFKKFAIDRGYHPEYLSDFAKRNKRFNQVYQKAKAWQESKVATEAFHNRGNSKIAQLMLNVHHDWIEKRVMSIDSDSKEAVKGMLKEVATELSGDKSSKD